MFIRGMGKLSITDRVTRNYQFKTFDRKNYLRAKELVEEYRRLYEDKYNEVISYSYNEFDYNEDTNGTLFYLMWSVPQRENETSFWPLPIPRKIRK